MCACMLFRARSLKYANLELERAGMFSLSISRTIRVVRVNERPASG